MIQTKQGYALFVTLLFSIGVSFFVYNIIQSNIFASNLNQLKYLHLQANIHLDFVKEYIDTHTHTQIENLVLQDLRFDLRIVTKQSEQNTAYHISIQTKDDTPIRLRDISIK